MKYFKYVCLLALLLMISCSSLKESMMKTGESLQEIAIHNAIGDFSTRCSLFKKDSVFHVSFKDTIYSAVLKQIDENYFWTKGSFYAGIVAVSIMESDYQFYYSVKTDPLPTRYIIKDGKLFYWWDKDYPVTEEIIAILRRYDRLQNEIIIPDSNLDDSQKGATYFFCRNDLSIYKRIITNKAIGGYKVPTLKCE